MELVADFCYGLPVRDKLTTTNVGHVMCASGYLQMSETGNLNELSKATLRELTTNNVPNCFEVLVSCMEISKVAEIEGVTAICVEAAVNSWYRNTVANGISWLPLKEASTWRTELKKLPAKWIALIMNSLLTKKCSLALMTFFAAGCLDFIMSFFDEASEMKIKEPKTSSYSPDSEQTQLYIPIDFSSVLSNPQDNEATAATSHEAPIVDFLSDLIQATSQIDNFSAYCPLSSLTEQAALRAYFELFLTYIPDKVFSLRVPEVTASWFAPVIHFAHKIVPQAVRQPLLICSAVYNQLVLDDVQSFSPELLVALNNLTQANHGHLSAAVEDLTDEYLNYRAQLGTITACQFSALLTSTSWCPRVSYDSPFQALEKLLEVDNGVQKLSQSDILEAIGKLDFTKLSQDALTRASHNAFIPKEITLEAAVAVCSQLRKELKDTNQQNSIVRSKLQDELRKTKMELQEMTVECHQWMSDAGEMKTYSKQIENELQELQSYPSQQLEGSWVFEKEDIHYQLPVHARKDQLFMTIESNRQITRQSSLELKIGVSPYNKFQEVESPRAPRWRSIFNRDFDCRSFVVTPGVVLPLGLSVEQVCEKWKPGQGAQARDGIPPYIVYDECQDCLYSPISQFHGGRRLMKWTRFTEGKK
jgi:hypothetical protein